MPEEEEEEGLLFELEGGGGLDWFGLLVLAER